MSSITPVVDTKLVKALSGTGLLDGGIITINGGNPARFDVSAGVGYIVDNHTSTQNPVLNKIFWNAFTSVVVSNLATQRQTYIGIDINGAIVQQAAQFSNEQARDIILLGRIDHSNLSTIDTVTPNPRVIFNAALDAEDLSFALGPINMSGNVYQAASTDMTIKKPSGKVYATGISYGTNNKNPNVRTNPIVDPVTFTNTYRSVTPGLFIESAPTTSVVANLWDDSGTQSAVATNKWTVQRIFMFPADEETVLHRGQVLYNTKDEAKAAIPSSPFLINPDLDGFMLRGFLVVRGGATNLSDPADAEFINASKFGESSVGGGGSGGDFVGPASSTTNNLISFADTTGKLGADSGLATAAVTGHIASTSNPHSVTANQVLPSQATHTGKFLQTDGSNTSWQTAAGGGYTDEDAQDAVGNILTDSATIDFTYNDGANTITADVIQGGIDHANIANTGTGTGHHTSTTTLTEGTNLYYTEGRVSANTDVAANTAARHNAVTLGTTNGLSLSTQQLSLAAASTSTTGALTSTDWNTFNSKQAAGNYITALTSDVTASGPGSAAATIAAQAVTNAKLANVATATFKGRTTSGTGSPEDLTVAQAKTMLNLTGTNSGDQLIFQTIACPAGTNPVADTTTDTLTFTAGTGLTITGDSTTDTIAFALNLGAIDHNSLLNLATGDVHTQYTKDPGTVVDKEITTWSGTGGRDFNTSSGITIGASTAKQIVPTGTNENLLIDGNGTGLVQLNTGASSQQFPKARAAGGMVSPRLTISAATGQMSWVDDGIAATDQLQTAYDSTTSEPKFQLNNTKGGITIWDAATPITGSLLTVASSAGTTKFFDVTSSKIVLGKATELAANILKLGSSNQAGMAYSGTGMYIDPKVTGSGALTIGSAVGTADADLMVNFMGIGGSAVSATAVVNAMITGGARTIMNFELTFTASANSATISSAKLTDQGTNASYTGVGYQSTTSADTSSHTNTTYYGYWAQMGYTSNFTATSGTQTIYGVRVQASAIGVGVSHTAGTFRRYGFFQDAITVIPASPTSDLIMGAFFNNSINIVTDQKVILDSTSTALGTSYFVKTASTSSIDTYVGGTQILLASSAGLKLPTVGTGLFVKEGTNATMGASVLVAGTVVVSTTKVTANSRIMLTNNTLGGTAGFLRVSARTAGTSFTILSSNGADTSTIAWIILEAA